jgi:flagellin-like protein
VAKRKGISPVIATVIIVAVTIAVAIAVAFWMTGIVGLFTGAEKLEIVSINAAPAAGGGGWTIMITVRNTGTTTTSIDSIYINGYLAFTTAAGANTLDCVNNLNPNLPIPLIPGAQQDIIFNIDQGPCRLGENQVFIAAPGGSIEVKLHSTGGKEYPKLVVLP